MADTSTAPMIVSGRIFTADRSSLWAEAIVIDGDTISFVGPLPEARAIAGPEAVTLDAGQGVVLPGFVDGHAHLLHAGAALTRAPLRHATSLDEIADELRLWVAANPDAPRVLGVGWVFSALPDSTPTREMLDAIVPDRPVYLDASDLHSVWVNSAALAELGIDDTTPDPIGGRIVRDDTGRATGLLLENAGYHIAWPVMNQTTDGDDDRYLQAIIAAYLASGTTAAVDMAFNDGSLAAIERAAERGQLPFTVVAHWLINRTGDAASELAQVARAAELAAIHRDGPVRIAGIKLITDGTIDGCTAGMLEPFTNHAPGEMIWPRAALEPVVLAADEAGLQIAMHAIGDLAVRTALDVLELAAARRAERGDHAERRHRIEHLEYVDEADVPRLAALGVTASMQPVHVDPAYLDNWVELLGSERAQRGFAWPEYRACGTTLAFGTDTPTAAHQPLPNMFIAATRCSPSGPGKPPLRPDFALPLDESVVHATADAAWASFEEDRRGRLAAGLAADFIVLDRNPFEDGPDSLLGTRVLRTVVAGRTVYTI
jgi:predicted amidohydrolase YtcJ